MKQRDLYLIVAAVLIFVCLASILSQQWSNLLHKNRRSGVTAGIAPSVVHHGESAAPSIESMAGGRLGAEMKSSQAKPASLAQVYSQYPAEDTGNNMTASWKRISPEVKTKAIEQLDQQITEAKEAVKVNPEDKKAKHTLFVSETLKKMCKSNFDFSLLETVPQSQGGLKPKRKR